MPDVAKMLSPEVVAAVGRLDVQVRMLLEGLFAGLRLSRRKGMSIEWSGHREYIPGDDPAYIDWRLYARTDRFYVKEFHAETNLRCHLVLDATASMDYTSGPPLTKFSYGVALAAAFGWFLAANQDRVGLAVLGGDFDTYVPPASRRVVVTRIMGILSELKAEGKGSLPEMLRRFAGRLTRQGLCIVVSDLLDTPEDTLEALKALARARQEVVVFHTLDPIEKNFDFREGAVFRDPESGMQVDADPARIGSLYRGRIASVSNIYRVGLAGTGMDYVPVDTSRPFIDPLMEFVRRRGKRH